METILKIKQWKDPNRIYSFALKAHSKKAMENKFTRILNLISIDFIEKLIKKGGKFFVLLKNNRPVSIISITKGFHIRSLENYKKIIHKKEWMQVGSMLTDKKERGEGYSKKLFNYALKTLEKDRIKYCYAVVTGTWKIENKGIARKISIPVEKICQEHKGKLVGYDVLSYGPIYRLKV